MKKAYEYLDEIESIEFPQSDDMFHRNSVVEKLIKQIQEDVIRETVQECAENAEIEEYDEHFQYSPHVNKNSILSIADKLIKEL